MTCPGVEKLKSGRVARGPLVWLSPVLICLAMIGNAVLPVAAAVNPTTTIPLGFTPNQVVTADMNGDGKLDLLVSGAAQAVLLGNGDGTFKPPIITFAAGTVSAVGDFNGDGKLDLAVGSYYGGVTILLGNGDGTFGQYIPFSSDPVQGLAAADLNGDGRSDLVVTSFQETTVYISNGNGTFQAGARYAAASGVRALLADFNGDGKTDMVRLNYSSQAQFLAGVGDGTFLAPVQLPFQSTFAAVADLNGDGKPDLAFVSNSFPACISVALGNGDGSFGFGGSACNGIEGGNPVVADLNRDGKPDVAVAQVGAVMTAIGDGLGGLANASVAPISNHDDHWTATGDFNGDGKADLAVTNNQSGSLTIYLNDGGTSYPLGDALVSPSSLAFGSVPAWSTSQPQSVTISNPGPGYLYFSGRTGLGNFTESNDCLPGTVVAPGASCTFQVTFNPPTSGPQTGSTTIYDSASSDSQYVTFSGNGTINPSTTTVAPASGPQGGTVNLTGTLTSNGAPLAAGGSVTLSLPNGWTGSTFVYKTGNFGWFGASLAGLGPGVYPNGIKAVYAGDGAYTGSSATADLTVTAPAPSIAVAPASGTYGGSANLAGTISEQGSPLSGVTLGFALNGVSVGTATTDAQGTATLTSQLGGLAAGTHPSAVTVSFAGNSVYPSSGGSGDLVVSPAPLTITASSATMTYGGAPPAITASYTGFVNGDTAASLTAAPTCTTTASPQSNVGAYPTSCSGAVDANYTIGYVAGSMTVGPAPLTVAADNQGRLFGFPNPGLTATITGFVNGDTGAVVQGAPSCTTAATQYSPGGSYPIVCTQGTLSAANYTFGPFVPGTLKVGFTAIITGSVSSVTVSAGQSVLIAPGAMVIGPLNVQAGGALDVEGATTGTIASSGAVAIRVCGATTAKLTIEGTSSLVVVGDDEARPGLPACTGNKIGGPASVSGNSGGVEFDANTVSGYLTITGNTGTTPDGGTVDVAGNTVGGKTSIQP